MAKLTRALPVPLLALLTFLALVASPEAASACAVCTGGQTDEVRYAFIWTTGFLSVLPLALIGGLVWFLRRRFRELEERRQGLEGRPAPVAPTFRNPIR